MIAPGLAEVVDILPLPFRKAVLDSSSGSSANLTTREGRSESMNPMVGDVSGSASGKELGNS